jgi:hypothetical protein
MLIEEAGESSVAQEFPILTVATEIWLAKLHAAFEDWRQSQQTQVPGSDLWQQVVRWYAAFDLSFWQLSQYVDNLTDVEDARLALEEGGASFLIDRVRMLPLARQRLRALAPELQTHLLKVHLNRLFAHPSSIEEERISGMDALYRIRAHGCRVVYHHADQGPLVLAVTQMQWPHPLREITAEQSAQSSHTGVTPDTKVTLRPAERQNGESHSSTDQ